MSRSRESIETEKYEDNDRYERDDRYDRDSEVNLEIDVEVDNSSTVTNIDNSSTVNNVDNSSRSSSSSSSTVNNIDNSSYSTTDIDNITHNTYSTHNTYNHYTVYKTNQITNYFYGSNKRDKFSGTNYKDKIFGGGGKDVYKLKSDGIIDHIHIKRDGVADVARRLSSEDRIHLGGEVTLKTTQRGIKVFSNGTLELIYKGSNLTQNNLEAMII